MIEFRSIPTRTHGRVLVQYGSGDGVVLGFHGYYESADTQMARLHGIPGQRPRGRSCRSRGSIASIAGAATTSSPAG